MKKLFLAVCLTAISASSFAVVAQPIRETYVSSCGASWSLVSYSGASGISNLESACDSACGTNITLITSHNF